MKRIFKYRIKIDDLQEIQMPVGAEILTVQVQQETPCIWAMVDDDVPIMHTRRIETFGTGHAVQEAERKYIGTYQIRNGALVFHVFEQF
jgi:predicted regulator of amino acid metabolism with ACT domain